MSKRDSLVAAATACFVLLLRLPVCSSGAELVPNPEFDKGQETPENWKLSGGKGRWVDRQILEVTGTGKDSNDWRTDACRFTPGGLYHFQVRTRRISGGGGCTISGPSFANRDYSLPIGDWRWYGHVFRAPDNPAGHYLRVGQWESPGTVQFDAVRLTPTIPVHTTVGGLLLGEGESIENGRYVFRGTFEGQGGNFHRTLASATAGFNSGRWSFGGNDQVTYRFSVFRHPFQSGEVSFHVNHHTRGACLAEVSRDEKQWHAVASKSGLGSAEAKLPADLFPADALLLRLQTATPDSGFQVNQIEFQATLSSRRPDASGKTLFADVATPDAAQAVESITLQESSESGRAMLHITARNPSQRPVWAELGVRLSEPNGPGRKLPSRKAEIAPGGRTTFVVTPPSQKPGENHLELALDVPGMEPLRTVISFTLPDFHRADYGEFFDGVGGKAQVWWCDAAHKVPRQRPMPTQSGPAARLAAARHDYEAVQVVVRASQSLRGLTATASELTGPGGAVIPRANVNILRVCHHFVHHPTDQTGVRDWWPDALPPITKPIDVPAGQNQPLWVLVYVPKDAKPGDYVGSISLKAEGWSAEVPLRLHVWDFTLPEKNHLETAFGLSTGEIFRYHQLKTDADKRKVLDMYFQCFAEHRISPYDPTPLDPIRVKFLPEADPPRAELDFTAFDGAMARAIEKFHFTNFSLPIQGMGGGTFHARHEPQIGKFGEKTPQYQAMFSSQVKQLESHLRERGWLNMAYVYWFDEPEPKDYAFVRGGMERIRKYAPGIQRMLTEEPCDELGGAVDIWCPVSFNYDHTKAEKRRAQGERIWWYVCCGPKAPHCTLFIDHPATELRIWHWQTWQRKIAGTLVWSTNYWTSSAAFPGRPQNPYEDPMGYVSGYSTPAGTKVYWGNGDGRFIYPPESAAVPGLSGDAPVIEPPVSSIRWEMLREGVEDYEYLWLLRDLLAKRRSTLSAEEVKQIETLLEVPEAITKDMTTLATDPAPIYARRAAIAEAIERLSK